MWTDTLSKTRIVSCESTAFPYNLLQIITTQMIGRYAIDARNNPLAELSVRDRANCSENHKRPAPRTSAIQRYVAPLNPITAGMRLVGKSAAENMIAWRAVLRPSRSTTDSMGNPALA